MSDVYRCEARSVEAFLAQLIRYVSTGHYFYFSGELKPKKNPHQLDAKIVAAFGLNAPKWRRWRRPSGTPSIHYLRFQSRFVILGTHGRESCGAEHRLFREYPGQVRDIRKQSIRFHGYSVRYSWAEEKSKRRVNIRLDKETYAAMREELLERAVSPRFENRELMERIFLSRAREFQPYGPVHQQLTRVLQAVNRRRRYAGYARIRKSRSVPVFIAPTKVFVEPSADNASNFGASAQRKSLSSNGLPIAAS